MRKYEVYKNIRKGAMIWGFPISLFALLMLSILASLLIIIFSFSFMITMGITLWNSVLYMVLTKIAGKSISLKFNSVFPKIISNKKNNILHYVDY